MNDFIEHTVTIPKTKEAVAITIFTHLERLVATTDEQHLQKLAAALEPQPVSAESTALARKIAGKDYVSGSSLELELANLHRYYQRRRELLANSLTLTEVAALLAETTDKVLERLETNSLIGMKDGGTYKFPIWQFDPEGNYGVIEGLPEVLAALHVSNLTRLNWLSKPHRAFARQTPLSLLKQGEIEAVIVEARVVGMCQ